MTSIRHEAIGRRFSIAAPHSMSAFWGVNAAMKGRNLHETTLLSSLASMLLLPHLSGLGGDAMIIQCNESGRVTGFNGSGCCGSGHHPSVSQINRTKNGRRGWFSALVYGAPSAFENFSKTNDISLCCLRHEANELLRQPPAPVDNYLRYYYSKYAKELSRLEIPKVFDRLLNINDHQHPSSELFEEIVDNGFESFYSGEIGAMVGAAAENSSHGVFNSDDFVKFQPLYSDVFSLEILDAKITMIGQNTPWLELSCLLKVMEMRRYVPETASATEKYVLCLAAGLIDQIIAQMNLTRIELWSQTKLSLVEQISNTVFHDATKCGYLPVLDKGSNTTFLASACSSGSICGVSSSIFTPFGSLVDPVGNGIILSTRAMSFSQRSGHSNCLAPKKYPSHTANAIICETSKVRFAVGTSGGPVQSMVLAQVLFGMIRDSSSPQKVLEQTRVANMGHSSKYGKVMFVTDDSSLVSDSRFYFDRKNSPKLGVTQIAGVRLSDDSVFAATDPRGGGVALAF